jgi:hypothetical protein
MLHNIYLGLHGLLVRQIKIKPQKKNICSLWNFTQKWNSKFKKKKNDFGGFPITKSENKKKVKICYLHIFG